MVRAATWPADAVLIAGDLFNLDHVERDTIAFLQAEFDALHPLPILIAPGECDPYVPHSPYATASWPSNVTIFDQPQWTSRTFEGLKLIIHGVGRTQAEMPEHPFGSLELAAQEGWTQVALAHALERHCCAADRPVCVPFDAASADRDGLAYLALGHEHTMMPVPGGSNTVMYYSGSPEGHGFDDPGKRYYLEVEIEDAGVQVTPVPCASVLFGTHTLDCSGLDSVEQIIDAVRALAADADNSNSHASVVSLTGMVATELLVDMDQIQQHAASAFEGLRLMNNLEPLDDLDELAQGNTCLGVFIQRLSGEIADVPDDARLHFVRRARSLGLAAYRQQQPHGGLREED